MKQEELKKELADKLEDMFTTGVAEIDLQSENKINSNTLSEFRQKFADAGFVLTWKETKKIIPSNYDYTFVLLEKIKDRNIDLSDPTQEQSSSSQIYR